MSTPATIIVHVRKEDVGRFMKCNPNNINLLTKEMFIDFNKKTFGEEKGLEVAKRILDCGYDEIPDMDVVISKLKKVKLGNYVEIYHHWDGEPESLGKELLEKYNSYEKALNLVLAGDFSTIMDGSVPYIGWRCSWEACKPLMRNKVPKCELNYQYKFEPATNTWYYRSSDCEVFKILK